MAVPDETGSPAVVGARACLDREAETLRTEAVDRALSELAETGELTDAQRAAVERLSERLVDQLLAGPRARLAVPGDRDRAARTVRALFEPSTRESGH